MGKIGQGRRVGVAFADSIGERLFLLALKTVE